eukprot:391234-Prymnesium_polylepis.1
MGCARSSCSISCTVSTAAARWAQRPRTRVRQERPKRTRRWVVGTAYVDGEHSARYSAWGGARRLTRR